MVSTAMTRKRGSGGSRWRRAALLACLCAVGAVAGCGGGDGATNGAVASQGANGKSTVTVAYMATASDAALVLGDRKGFFDEAGIDLQLKQVPTTGAVSIPALLKGEYDIAGGGIDAPMIAADKGLPVRILAADGVAVSKGTTFSADSKQGTSAIVVPKDSDIRSAADLAGKKLAAITVQGLQYLCIAGALDKQGVNPKDARVLEIPAPEMLPALDSGRVDAATLVEPFLTLAKQKGYRVVSYPCEESIPGGIQAGYYTSAKWAEQNPDVARKVTEALVRSDQYAEKHQDEVRQLIPKFTKISPGLAKKITLSSYKMGEAHSLDAVAAAVQRYGLVDHAPNLDKLLVGG